MKKIPLTRGKFATLDDADYERLSNFNYYCTSVGYAARKTRDKYGKVREVFMHNDVMPPPKGMELDHKDLNKLNNQRGNLRICTHSQNSCNRRKKSTNTSGYKGVTLHKKSGKWYACIKLNGKRISLGYFDEKSKAAIAYNEGAIKYHGEFAYLNPV